MQNPARYSRPYHRIGKPRSSIATVREGKKEIIEKYSLPYTLYAVQEGIETHKTRISKKSISNGPVIGVKIRRYKKKNGRRKSRENFCSADMVPMKQLLPLRIIPRKIKKTGTTNNMARQPTTKENC